ncbi:PEP-CTERM sorting domain-containing protein [Geobacter sp.]|uniref:PEP-CTERM sorting domain-containing protein n=1 Tax=Geobacter sp. TaxID=46610 RepID=UPI001AD2ADAE|nr:PEP-CTERM sorting domain-containing protein [Geobacter sp.]CAG0992451.1 hypothetical protein ANRL3_02870 [Anaerolineae bacterium]
MKFRCFLKVACIVICSATFTQQANATVINGGFESGLDRWSLFTTANGTLGDSPLPQVAAFDVAGNSVSSDSLKLSVGYATAPCSFPGLYCSLPTEGGGIQQSVSILEGVYSLNVDIAVENTPLYGGRNGDGGTFYLILDGLVLDQVSFGEITANSVKRDQLNFQGLITEGLHDFQILVTRNYAQSDSLFQYIDNATVTPVPEPNTLGLLAVGCVVAFWARRKLPL